MERTWTDVGAEYVERLGRSEVESEIDALDWQEIPQDGKLTVAFMPGAAINEAIREFGMPQVSRVAIGSFEREEFYPGFYGIEANYKNGRARVYVLDLGTQLTPLASDFEGKATADVT